MFTRREGEKTSPKSSGGLNGVFERTGGGVEESRKSRKVVMER